MAKITGDHIASAVQNSGARTNSGPNNGFEEQWLRALEQDHMETQMSKMHRTPFDKSPLASIKSPVPSTAILESGGEYQGKGVSGAFKTNSSEMNSTVGRICGIDIKSGILDERGAAPQPNIRVDASGNAEMMQQIPNIKQKLSAVRSNMDWSMVRRMLPPSSSLSILFTDEGLHVVIRDANLQPADLRRLLGKIRTFFISMKANLASITLNGIPLWKCRPDVDVGRCQDFKQIIQGINKLY